MLTRLLNFNSGLGGVIIEFSAKVAYFKRKYGSNAESASLKKLFTDFDRDGDGLITLSELSMAMLDFDKDCPPNELSTIFEKVDKNKDQRIDFKEFSDLVVALEAKYGKLRITKATGTVGSTVQNTFEDFYKDKDGLVTLDEIRLHLLHGLIHDRGGTQKNQKRSILLYEVYFSQKKYLLRAKRRIFVQ